MIGVTPQTGVKRNDNLVEGILHRHDYYLRRRRLMVPDVRVDAARRHGGRVQVTRSLDRCHKG
jgi:hypothetical protein